MATWDGGLPFASDAFTGAAATTQLCSSPALEAFDPSLSSITDCDLQLAWQSMLQQQALIQQQASFAPYFNAGGAAAGLSSFFPFAAQQQQAAAALQAQQQFTSACSSSTSSEDGQQQQQVIVPELQQVQPTTIDASADALKAEDVGANLFTDCFGSLAAAAADHYSQADPPAPVEASTACRKSSVAAGTRKRRDPPSTTPLFPATISPRDGSMSGAEEVEEDDCDSASASGGSKRKRKPYWRQTWYKERNKEYSRNWRSKKKMEEETLRSEIAELRAYRRLVEDALDMHVHDPTSGAAGFPFSYASPGLARLLGVDCADDLAGLSFIDMVVPEDRPQVRAAMDKVATLGAPADVCYRLRCGPTGAARPLRSTLRRSEQGILAVTFPR